MASFMTFVNPLFILSLIFISSPLPAQEEARFPEGVAPSAYRYREALPQDSVAFRIEPPYWWAGMDWPVLQLLVHGNRIGNAQVEVDYPGVQLQRVHRVANPNYLFLDLQLGSGLQPGTFEIILSQDGATRAYPYEIKAREPRAGRLQGIGPEDLIYLVMPDRFANGFSGNDSIDSLAQTGVGRENVYFRHGGDLIGIMEHLDYLEDLGVTALWLNPVLENDQPYESYHGYAVTDHYRVDPRLGNNEQYRQLVKLCHERGIKVIMDIIHNHVGDAHWFIRDLPMEDWIHQGDTLLKTSYRAPALMDPYAAASDRQQMLEGWFDNHMPDLNQQNPFVANYLLQNNLWWAEYSGQDGYRIDTYPYPDPAFMSWWAAWMQRVLPGYGLFGETWVHGPAIQAQFTEDNELREGFNSHLPAVTDFQLHYAMHEALLQEQGWTSGVSQLYYTLAQDFLYEDPYRNVLFLDNHDLPRIFTTLGQDLSRFKSGIALLMTLRGVPMLYYGTEILMTGAGGAFGEGGRLDFPGGWPQDTVDKFKREGRTPTEQEAFEYVRTLAQYRKAHPVLHRGQLTQFIPENGVYVYFRHNASQTIMVVYNSNAEAVTVPTQRYAERMLGYSKAQSIGEGGLIEDLSALTLGAHSTLVLELQP